MVGRLKYPMIWLAIVALAGLVGRYAFNASFWVVALITAFSLVVNGLVIKREDRQKGGWSE
jgi:uncharacterized membrane protein